MSRVLEVNVPDIGDFEHVPVIEVLVSEGDRIDAEQSLITLESDKATMEVPSPAAGTVSAIAVAVGDEVSEGDVILSLEVEETAEAGDESASGEPADDPPSESPDEIRDTGASAAQDESSPGAAPADSGAADSQGASAAPAPATPSGAADAAGEFDCDVLVLGSGPGGYTAAFRAADLGLSVTLVERYPSLGGVCLNVGCIPSKALLHAAEVIEEAEAMGERGVVFGAPEIQLDRLREWKDGVVGQLTGGLTQMAEKRGVTVVQGTGRFTGPNELRVEGEGGARDIRFRQTIVAAGSESMRLPGLPWDDPRVMDSTGALELDDIPGSLLVIGGGIIGLEMATVYAALGSAVTVVELTGQLMPGTDKDLVRPLQKRLQKQLAGIHVNTRVVEVRMGDNALTAVFDGEQVPERNEFDRVLVAVGRVPNGDRIGLDAAGVEVNEKGFVPVDQQMRTNQPHIFAIGDIVGPPMLAHKATHEGKVAAEVCAGEKSRFDQRVIPSVAYTDPEVAYVGVTETMAKEQGIDVGVGKFPWAASGRALGIGRSEGFTKLIFDPETDRIIGAGIVGPNAGDLISECALAIEMGAEAADIGLTIHPHPTLSESVGMAAEAYEGTITDLYLPRKKR